MLYGFLEKCGKKCNIRVSITMHFGNKSRNMKNNWNKEPHTSNIALRKGRGVKLSLRWGISIFLKV